MASVTVACMNCRQAVVAPVPVQEIVNRPNLSFLMIEHNDRFMCSHCGSELTLAVANVQVGLVGAPAPPKPSGLVLAQS